MIEFGDIAIMGGGCYGSFYLGQLLTARSKGALEFRNILVVDRSPDCQAAVAATAAGTRLVVSDWNAFLDDWLDASRRDQGGLIDTIVPTPLMPHLMAQWFERRARARWPGRDVALVPVQAPVGTPYDRNGADGVRYVSYADWLCPVHCIEPLVCPAIKAPRTWDMAAAITVWSEATADGRLRAPPALFSCRHATYGVGMYPVQGAFSGFDALAPVAASETGGELVIGSISACHGAVAVLRVGPRSITPQDVLYSPHG